MSAVVRGFNRLLCAAAARLAVCIVCAADSFSTGFWTYHPSFVDHDGRRGRLFGMENRSAVDSVGIRLDCLRDEARAGHRQLAERRMARIGELFEIEQPTRAGSSWNRHAREHFSRG